MTHLEAQRTMLGDVAVDAVLAGLRQELSALQHMENQEPREHIVPALAGERLHLEKARTIFIETGSA